MATSAVVVARAAANLFVLVVLDMSPPFLVDRPVRPSDALDRTAAKGRLAAGKAAPKCPLKPSQPLLASPPMATEFRILGPLEVVDNGSLIDLGAQKQRVLLAMLLLHANEVVSVDRLLEAVWEDEPPARADKALQVYVSQLRKALGRERLEAASPGYRLMLAKDELDALRFERLLADGKPKEALALWRGEALSDFAFSRFARREAARLDELR